MTQPDFGNVTQPKKSGGGRPPIMLIAVAGILLLCGCFAIFLLTGNGGDDRAVDSDDSPRQEEAVEDNSLDDLLEDFPTDEAVDAVEDDTPLIVDEGESTLVLLNSGDVEVCYVFISPTGGDDWGADQLPEGDDGIVLTGEEMSFSVDAGIYDVQARDCDDTVLDEILEAPLDGGEEILWEIE